MKKNLLHIAILSISLFVSVGAVKAQVTIFEQDGALQQMTPASWTITNDMGFSNNTQISIGKNEKGTLALNNTVVYKDVTIEIHLANGNPNTQFPITFNSFGSGKLTQLVTYKLNGGMNKILFTFVSPTFTPINLKEMVFTNNTANAVKISYIKITGIPTSAGLDLENSGSFDVKVNPNNLIINSETEGTLSVFNSIGQVEGTYTLTKGENTVMNSTKGMSFLVLTNSNNELIGRKKIMR